MSHPWRPMRWCGFSGLLEAEEVLEMFVREAANMHDELADAQVPDAQPSDRHQVNKQGGLNA